MSIMVLVWLLPTLLAAGLLVLATQKAPLLQPRTYAEAAAGLSIAGLPFIVAAPFTVYTQAVLFVLQLWVILLCGRVIFGRLDAAFVRGSTWRNLALLLAGIGSIIGLWWLGVQVPGVLGGYEWRIVAGLCALLVVVCIGIAQLAWASRHYKLIIDPPQRRMAELPTVSVCIPARNEDHALEDCLNTVLASNYPKLEVLVLDDCSHDNTSYTIRSYAHDGVRFIKGETPASGWLGKNQAMHTLAEHASGDYILFMDADTRLSVTSIAQLVDYMLDNRMEMLSVLPQNRLGYQPGAVLGTLHELWQMVLPITRRRIAVARQAWLINANALRSLGGFASVSHKIIPEGSFARRLFAHDTYRFIAGNAAVGITTAKRWRSELESATRLRYPTYKRQPVYALAAAAAIAALYIGPFAVAGALIAQQQWNGILALALFACMLLLCVHGYVARRTHPRAWVLRTFLLPLLAAQEVVLILVSMVQYEFGEVNWKGRNVCYPVISSVQTQKARLATRLHH